MLETFGLLPLLAVAIVLLWLLFSAIPIVNKYDCLVVFHFGRTHGYGPPSLPDY